MSAFIKAHPIFRSCGFSSEVHERGNKVTAAPAVRAGNQLPEAFTRRADAPLAEVHVTAPPTVRSAGRDPYYHSMFEAFLSYIADGEPFSMRTTALNGSTDVTLRFKTETLARHIEHLAHAFPEAP